VKEGKGREGGVGGGREVLCVFFGFQEAKFPGTPGGGGIYLRKLERGWEKRVVFW